MHGLTTTYADALAASKRNRAANALLNEVATCERCALERLHGIAHHCARHYGLRFDVAAILKGDKDNG